MDRNVISKDHQDTLDLEEELRAEATRVEQVRRRRYQQWLWEWENIEKADPADYDLSVLGMAHFEGPGVAGIQSDTPTMSAPPVGRGPADPLGHVVTSNAADSIWSPMFYAKILTEAEVLVVPISIAGMNLTSNPDPSHAQLEACRHIWCGPKGKHFGKYRLTSVTNAYANGRLKIVHVPYGVSAAEVKAMTATQLMQYSSWEHEIKGGEDTIIEPEWTVPYPKTFVRGDPDSNGNNGYLVAFWIEHINTAENSSLQLSLWADSTNIEFSFPAAFQKLPKVPSSYTARLIGRNTM
jgi:hypothetical protein